MPVLLPLLLLLLLLLLFLPQQLLLLLLRPRRRRPDGDEDEDDGDDDYYDYEYHYHCHYLYQPFFAVITLHVWSDVWRPTPMVCMEAEHPSLGHDVPRSDRHRSLWGLGSMTEVILLVMNAPVLRRHLQEQEGYEVYDIFERGRERVPTQVRLWLEDRVPPAWLFCQVSHCRIRTTRENRVLCKQCGFLIDTTTAATAATTTETSDNSVTQTEIWMQAYDCGRRPFKPKGIYGCTCGRPSFEDPAEPWIRSLKPEARNQDKEDWLATSDASKPGSRIKRVQGLQQQEMEQ